MYTKYPHHKIHHRIYHLNNRDLAIAFGVIGGMLVGIYGMIYGHFTNVPVLGNVIGHSFWFKIMAIILSGGVFGNLLSYVGSCIDIFTNHQTIFDLLKLKDKGI